MNVLIVLNYNDYETTIQFVEHVIPYTNLHKIIIVDNASTDNSLQMLLQIHSNKVEVIKTNLNNGYASGNNFGAFYAIEKYAPEYLFISNPDVEFSEETLDTLLSEAIKVSKLGAMTCKMKCTSGIYMPIAWKLPNYRKCLLENFILLKKLIGDRNEYSKKHYFEQISEVEVIPGSFFMMPAKVFREIRGFDEDTFLYYEENILAFRIQERGYKNYILSNREYIHRHSISINKNIMTVKKRLEICFQSRLIYCEKYLHIGRIRKKILWIAFKIGLFDYLLAKKLLKK